MREFEDGNGDRWIASVEERSGDDYKGRFQLVMSPAEGNERYPLRDVRWNSERTARRTLETMSEVELRRRLRTATGRSASPTRRRGLLPG